MRRPLLILTLALLALGPAASAAAKPAYTLDRHTGEFTNPPTAPATTPLAGSATTNPLVPLMWQAAVRYWGGAPAGCAAGVTIALSDEDSDASPKDKAYSGWVYGSDLCTMYLNIWYSSWPITAKNAEEWCQVITHEAGHMLGLEHTRDKRNIMSGGWIPYVNKECKAFAPKRGRG